MTPLVDRMIEGVLGGSIVYTDDTTVTLLTPGEGKGAGRPASGSTSAPSPVDAIVMHQSEPDNGGSLATVVLGACPRRQAAAMAMARRGACPRGGDG